MAQMKQLAFLFICVQYVHSPIGRLTSNLSSIDPHSEMRLQGAGMNGRMQNAGHENGAITSRLRPHDLVSDCPSLFRGVDARHTPSYLVVQSPSPHIHFWTNASWRLRKPRPNLTHPTISNVSRRRRRQRNRSHQPTKPPFTSSRTDTFQKEPRRPKIPTPPWVKFTALSPVQAKSSPRLQRCASTRSVSPSGDATIVISCARKY
jgi:hypothetical protein